MSKFKSLSPQEAKEIMDSGENYTLIDVRDAAAYNSIHIKDAVNIPLNILTEDYASLLPDKHAQILIYCQGGGKSMDAAYHLAQQGYTNVSELGGINSWPYSTVK